MIIAILEAFRDLIIGLMPKGVFFKLFDGEFGFICHPLDAKDAARKYPFTKGINEKIFEIWTSHFWPVVGAQILGDGMVDGKPLKGYAVVCPLSPATMVKDPDFGRKMISRTARLCEKMGLKLVALGGYNSIITHDGEDLLDKTSLAVTTGNTYSVLLVIQNLKKIAEELAIDLKKIKVGIIGAAGSVGHACSLLIPELVDETWLMDTNGKALRALTELCISNKLRVKTFDSLDQMKNIDIVITATSTPRAIIYPEHVRSGMVFIDASQPKNIAEDLAKRSDILVIDSGIAKVPKMECQMEMGPYKNEVYACLGEAMVLTSNREFVNFSIGKVHPKKVSVLAEMVKKAKFELPPFRNAGGYFSADRIKHFKNNYWLPRPVL